MKSTILAVVGAFLDAGKTTLIPAGARSLQREGTRVGVILNDQGGAEHVSCHDAARCARRAGMPERYRV